VNRSNLMGYPSPCFFINQIGRFNIRLVAECKIVRLKPMSNSAKVGQGQFFGHQRSR
jgi:hypothetical protein